MGTEPEFHGGARNDATACAICHNPNLGSGGWSADTRTYIHAIHGASKRGQAFTWTGVSVADNYSKIVFPGDLKKCDTCHLPGTYDFSASTYAAALFPNLLNVTVATGKYDGSTANKTAFQISPYVTKDNVKDYGVGFSYNPATNATVAAAGTTLVNSPMASTCFSCHDSAAAQTHMNNDGGGSIYRDRATALTRTETCLFCHGPGKIVAIKTMHGQ